MTCDRVRETKLPRKGERADAWHCGKTHDFGGLLQALVDPRGIPRRLSECRPVPCTTSPPRANCSSPRPPRMPKTCRYWPAADTKARAKACIPWSSSPKTATGSDPDTRTYNRLPTGLPCLGEHGLALLVRRWKTLQNVTTSPCRITNPPRAALVPTQFKHKMIT